MLIAILVPIASQVRGVSKRTVCAANLRTLGQAFQSYATDSGGWMPRGSMNYDSRKPNWVVVVARQLRPKGIDRWSDLEGVSPLQCPSHPTPGIPTAYVLNAFAMETQPEWKPARIVRVNKLRNQVGLPWLLETPDLFKTYRNFYDDIFFEIEHIVYSPDHLATGRTPRVNLQRHVNRTSNVLYADGHVDLSLRPLGHGLGDFDDGVRDRN
jgi:prepilin-type processing-associated H-X9-DG protein